MRLVILMGSLSLDYRMPEAWASELRGWLDRAVELSPNYLEAWESLAWVEAMAENPRIEVLNRVQRLVPRMRDQDLTLLAIALIRARQHDEATAGQIAGLLLDSPKTKADIRAIARKLDESLKAQGKVADQAATAR